MAAVWASAAMLAVPALAQVQYVDPAIGNVSILLVSTRPTVDMPNSMVRVYPMRADATDDRIASFPLTISSHRALELFTLMPGGGQPAAYDQEVTRPYYYATRFDGSLIQTEFTATERCGYFRFGFPDGKAEVVVGNRQPGAMAALGNRAVSGQERFQGMKAYVYGEFSRPVALKVETAGNGQRVVATAADAKELEFRYGISFIGVEQARRNLREEIPAWGFERVKQAGKARWNRRLGQIEVEGGTEAQKRVFYTALYRCSERMIDISEDGRYYSGFDHHVHADKRPFYVDNWLWDTFRALEPLETLLDPQREADKIQSVVRMYEQSGTLPTFNTVAGNMAAMNGNHAAPWIADAWFKGVRDFDLEKAYEGLRKRSLETTLLPWRLGPKTRLDDFYNQHGYMPALRPGEKETVAGVDRFEKRQPVPVTLGNSMDDWNIAHLAGVLGKTADEQLFMKRAANYRNLFRPDKAMLWPRDENGQWIEPMDPGWDGGLGGRDYYDENNGYTYQWDVNHDYSGLFALMGGRAKAEANLDELFRRPLGRARYEFQARFPDSTSMVGQFSMGNEPSFAIPYLYDRLGAPWKTQKRVRMLLETFFPATLEGIPGDEDGGGMSAFVVFSMMGFYPVTPGLPVYDIASPVFDKVTIHLKNGKNFVVAARNTSRQNKYVESIRLNGKPLNRVWFRHADLANGGLLELTMGSTPNLRLGAEPQSFPPDAITARPEDYER